jgi:hypothetical protein
MAKKEEVVEVCHKDANGKIVCERIKRSPMQCHVDENGKEYCEVVPKKKARKTKKGKKGKKRAKACS